MAGIAGGAEAIVVPESDHAPETIAYQFHHAYERGKRHAIVVAVEHLATDQHGILLGMVAGKVVSTPLSAVVDATKPLDAGLLEFAEILAR